MTGGDLPDAPRDPKRRLAEFSDVLTALERSRGRTFRSVHAANDALFEQPTGGRAGIAVPLRLAVLRLIVAQVDERQPAPQPLPAAIADQLGTYVYGLLDPRDRSILYVGTGRGNRIFAPVWTALGETGRLSTLVDTGAVDTEAADDDVTRVTTQRIRDIYDSGHAVEHYVVRHRIEPATDDDRAAAAIAQGLVDALRLVGQPVLTNLAAAHTETVPMPIEDLVLQYAAEPAPELPTPCIVLNVDGASKRGAAPSVIYELARQSWPAGQGVRNIPNIPVIVFADNIVRAVYRARSWEMVGRSNDKNSTALWRFTGEVDSSLEARFVNTRITPHRLGLKQWPTHGWVPRLTGVIPGAARATARPGVPEPVPQAALQSAPTPGPKPAPTPGPKQGPKPGPKPGARRPRG